MRSEPSDDEREARCSPRGTPHGRALVPAVLLSWRGLGDRRRVAEPYEGTSRRVSQEDMAIDSGHPQASCDPASGVGVGDGDQSTLLMDAADDAQEGSQADRVNEIHARQV